MTENTWQVFDLAEVKAKLKGEAVEYLEFLNVPALNCGIYFLAAGSTDMQAPHDEDEVYIVLSGTARMRLGDEERAVGPGSLLYVGADHAALFLRDRGGYDAAGHVRRHPLERN